MTGQVQFNEYRSGLNLNHPVNLAYNENNVLVTYYNNRNKIFEIWTVEQYQQKIETSPIKMYKFFLNLGSLNIYKVLNISHPETEKT